MRAGNELLVAVCLTTLLVGCSSELPTPGGNEVATDGSDIASATDTRNVRDVADSSDSPDTEKPSDTSDTGGTNDVAESGDSGDSDGAPEARTYISFDDDSYLQTFTSVKSGGSACDGNPCADNRNLVDSPARSGRALEVVWRDGKHQGAPMEMDLEQRWGAYPDEAYAQYWLYVPSDFQPGPQGGKLPGWGGVGSCGSAGDFCDGTDGMSARGGHTSENGTLKIDYYVYWGTMDEENEQYGDHTPGESPPRDQWVKIDQHIRLNTPGKADGVLQLWFDDRKVYERKDWYWRDEGHDEIKLEKWWFATYWGGSEPSPQENRLYFDDMRVSDEPINPSLSY